MPALVWRTRPARSIRRCDTICASAGFSFMVGRKYWLIRMLNRSLLGASWVAADCREQALQRQTWPRLAGFAQGNASTLSATTGGEKHARADFQAEREQDQRPDRDRRRDHNIPDDGLHRFRQSGDP